MQYKGKIDHIKFILKYYLHIIIFIKYFTNYSGLAFTVHSKYLQTNRTVAIVENYSHFSIHKY